MILISLSPFGEAKTGIPFGIAKGINVYGVFVICFLANVLVFPMMLFFLEKINIYLIRWKFYKKVAVKLAIRAKSGSKDKIKKYGFWGLMFFVMLPVPGTGVYVGTIATYILKIERKKAFWANTIGIFFSCVFVWVITLAAKGLF